MFFFFKKPIVIALICCFPPFSGHDLSCWELQPRNFQIIQSKDSNNGRVFLITYLREEFHFHIIIQFWTID
jgi:hypothetical protein